VSLHIAMGSPIPIVHILNSYHPFCNLVIGGTAKHPMGTFFYFLSFLIDVTAILVVISEIKNCFIIRFCQVTYRCVALFDDFSNCVYYGTVYL